MLLLVKKEAIILSAEEEFFWLTGIRGYNFVFGDIAMVNYNSVQKSLKLQINQSIIRIRRRLFYSNVDEGKQF